MSDFERGVLDDLRILQDDVEELKTQEYLQPGAAAGGLIPLHDIDLSSSDSTLDIVTSIPATYAHLLVVHSVQVAGGLDGGGVRMEMQFNDDTGSNYHFYNRLEFNSQQDLEGFADIGGADHIDVARVSGRDTVSDPDVLLHTSAGYILITDYADTTQWKTVVFGDFLRTPKRLAPSASDPDLTYIGGGGGWESAAAITKITMTTSSDTFAQHSRWTTYALSTIPGGPATS